MLITPGTILISAPALDDLHFTKAVILICEYNEQGATGFVINQLFPRKFNELIEFSRSKPHPLYQGGPVENEKLFFLHSKPATIEGGTPIADEVYWGGNFHQAVAQINLLPDAEKEIKLLLGYCGWDAGELEAEIEEGSWLITTADSNIVFSDNTEHLWEELYKQAVL